MSSETSQNPTSQKQELDPRMAELLFGGGGKKGIMEMGYEQAQKPATSEMTQMGRNAQANYLMSPQYSNMFNQMMSQGSNLMGRGVAPNPYGGSAGFGGSSGQGYTPNFKAVPGMDSGSATGSQTGQQFPVDPNKQTTTPEGSGGLSPEMLAWIQRMMQGGGGA